MCLLLMKRHQWKLNKIICSGKKDFSLRPANFKQSGWPTYDETMPTARIWYVKMVAGQMSTIQNEFKELLEIAAAGPSSHAAAMS